MSGPANDASAPDVEWDELSPGGEISATVIMASGFVLQEGQRVRERYRVERVIGEGGMGQVVAITLVGSSDKHTYALKVVARPVEAKEEGVEESAEQVEAARHAKWFAELLRQEAAKQDVVQRHGVAVARLFALVQLDDGSIGMRMELARGRSLESQVEEEQEHKNEAPEVLWSVTVVRKLVSQLRRLHEMVDTGSAFGFVHSDIKPGNVFVDDTDASDVQITLLDFGVATAGQALVQDLTMRHVSRQTFVLQQTGGTLGYTPPHHFDGKPTPLSDVHASLVILYELITGQFPWDFGDIEVVPDNLVQLEAAMLRGPRPVRDVRGSVPIEEARVLDEYFTREFKSLHALAGTVSRELGDKKEPPRSLVERLLKLARDYQQSLDVLRNRLSPSRRPVAADVTTPGGMPAIPRPPLTPKFLGSDVPETGESRPSHEISPTLLTRRKPKLIVMASVPPPPMSGGASNTSAAPIIAMPASAIKPPVRSPANTLFANAKTQFEALVERIEKRFPGLPWLWIIAGVSVPIVAIIVLLIVRAFASPAVVVPPPAPVVLVPRIVVPPISAPMIAPPPLVVAPVVPIVAPVIAPTTNPVAAPTSTDPTLTPDTLGNAPEVTAPDAAHHHHHHHRGHGESAPEPVATVPPGAQRCSCVAVAHGARVVAHGGTLGHEVVLCTATDPVSDGRAEFTGAGVIPADVIAAAPELSCRGVHDESLQITIQRYATATGRASLFQCRGRTQAPHEEPSAP